MCRLFGFRSVVPGRAHRSLMDAENALARQSTRHPDGWGIGWYVDEDAYIVKSQTAAHACDRFKRASSALSSHTMIVHVRKATVGTIDHLNAHPFRFGRWVMAHNGTIFGFEDGLKEWMLARIDDDLRTQILGDTDSEHLFYYLLSAISRQGGCRRGRASCDPAELGSWVRQALLELQAEALRHQLDRPIVNLLMTDGTTFLAHRAGMPLFLSTQKHFCSDFKTCPEPSKVCMLPVRPEDQPVNHLLVASERVGDENIWEDIADGTTLVLDDAFRLWRTEPPADWVAPVLPERYRVLSSGA